MCVCCCFSVVVFVVLVFVGSLLFRVCFLLYPLSVFSTDSTHTLTSATHRPCVFFRDTTHWHQSHTLPVCFEWHNTLTSVTHPPCMFLSDTTHWNQSDTLPVCFWVTQHTDISHTPSLCFFEWHNTLTSVTHPPCMFLSDTTHWHQSHTLPVCFLGTLHTDISHTPSQCVLGTQHPDISHTPSLCVFRDKKHRRPESHSFSLRVAGRVQVNGDAMAQREDQQDARGIGDRRAPRTRSASCGTLVRSKWREDSNIRPLPADQSQRRPVGIWPRRLCQPWSDWKTPERLIQFPNWAFLEGEETRGRFCDRVPFPESVRGFYVWEVRQVRGVDASGFVHLWLFCTQQNCVDESYWTSSSFFTVKAGSSFYLPVYICVCLANTCGVMGRVFSSFFALFSQPRQCLWIRFGPSQRTSVVTHCKFLQSPEEKDRLRSIETALASDHSCRWSVIRRTIRYWTQCQTNLFTIQSGDRFLLRQTETLLHYSLLYSAGFRSPVKLENRKEKREDNEAVKEIGDKQTKHPWRTRRESLSGSKLRQEPSAPRVYGVLSGVRKERRKPEREREKKTWREEQEEETSAEQEAGC